jgi:hypothetical protein
MSDARLQVASRTGPSQTMDAARSNTCESQREGIDCPRLVSGQLDDFAEQQPKGPYLWAAIVLLTIADNGYGRNVRVERLIQMDGFTCRLR